MGFAYRKQWATLNDNVAKGKIFNAYIFYGPSQVEEVAINFLKVIQRSDSSAHMFEYEDICKEKISPVQTANILFIEPLKEDKKGNEKKGNEITIGQVREMQQFVSLTAFNNSYKAVIIRQAQALNEEAQNAFLKILEEPKGKVVFILLSDSPERLLETVLSRCVRIFFPFAPFLLDEPLEKQYAKDLEELTKKDLAFRFEYAKNLLKDAEKAEGYGNLKKIFSCWLAALRRNMLDNLNQSQTGEFKKISYAIEKLQESIYLLETTNINPKLNLETFLLSL